MINKAKLELTDDTLRAIRDVLAKRERLSQDQIESVLREVNHACWMSLTIDLPKSPKVVRDELEDLYQALEILFNALQGMSRHSVDALWKTVRLDGDDISLKDYGETQGPAFEFEELVRRASRIARAIELTLEKTEVPRGGKPNLEARHLAFHVLVALEQHGITSTSTHDGTYFQVLGNVFEDVFEGISPKIEYERAGRWAVKKTDPLEETGFKSV